MPIYVSGSGGLTIYGSSSVSSSLPGGLPASRNFVRSLSSSTYVSASTFWGNGASLSGISAGEWDGTTTNPMSGSSTLEVVGKAYFGHNVYITGGIQAEALVNAAGGIQSTTYSGSSTLQAVGNAIIGGNLSVSGNIETAATGDVTANRGIFSNALTLNNGTAALPTVTATAAISGATSVTAGTFVGGNLNRHFINELTMSRPSVSTVKLHPGQCTDSTNTVYMNLTASVTLNIATTGIDALDTGAEASNTWYAAYVVSGTSGMGGLLSTSETSPTMPAGYTYKRRVGWARNDSSSDLLDFRQTGYGRERACYWFEVYTVTAVVTNGASSGFRTAVDCSALVPPSANGYHATFNPGDTSDQYRDTTQICPLAVSGTFNYLNFRGTKSDATAGGSALERAYSEFPVIRGDGQTIGFNYITYYNGNLTANVVGWK